MTTRSILALLLVLLTAAPAVAADLPTAKPEHLAYQAIVE
jgi:hypothetical protein